MCVAVASGETANDPEAVVGSLDGAGSGSSNPGKPATGAAPAVGNTSRTGSEMGSEELAARRGRAATGAEGDTSSGEERDGGG